MMAVPSAHRSKDGIYTSPFGPMPKLKAGTLFDYGWGKLHPERGKPGHEDVIRLKDCTTGKTWTERQARELITRVAATLISPDHYACKPGQTVSLCHPTTANYAILAFACARAGIVMALTNPAYTSEEMRHACELVEAKLVLTVPPLMPAFKAAGVPSSILIDASESSGQNTGKANLYSNLVADVAEAERVLAKASSNDIDWNSACGVFFSSGTTGLPKGVLVSHRNLINEYHGVISLPNYKTPSDWNADGSPSNGLVYLPAFHVAGFAALCITVIDGGCCAFAMKAPIDLPLIVRSFKEVRPYRAVIVPPLLLALTRSGIAGEEGLSKCVHAMYSAAAPCGKGLQEEAAHKLKIKIGQFWGMSETTGAVTGSSLTYDTRAGSVGQLLPANELKLIDEDGKIVPHGEPGEILMRGPMNMLGYYKNDKANVETLLKDGFLATGDVGYMDDDGFLYIVDRRKELIKYKAFQVAPAELEALLLTHPAVMDVGVTGVVEDESVGESPRAFIALRPEHAKNETILNVAEASKSGNSPKPSTSAKAQEIQDFVKSRVANYKQLRGGVIFVDEVPKNPSGKILRRVLRDIGKSKAPKAKSNL